MGQASFPVVTFRFRLSMIFGALSNSFIIAKFNLTCWLFSAFIKQGINKSIKHESTQHNTHWQLALAPVQRLSQGDYALRWQEDCSSKRLQFRSNNQSAFISEVTLSAQLCNHISTYRQFGKEIHQVSWWHDYGRVEWNHVAVTQLQVEICCQKLCWKQDLIN